MYIEHNIEARTYYHRCRRKAINITYFKCVFVAFGIEREMRIRNIVFCSISVSTIFFHIFS